MQSLKDLDIVALTTAVPEHGLRAGEVGTIVLVYNNGEAFEVEFIDDADMTFALVTVNASQVRLATAEDANRPRRQHS